MVFEIIKQKVVNTLGYALQLQSLWQYEKC
jgi:hypothetical protein